MVSDTLSTCVEELDRYLNDPAFHEVYTGRVRDAIRVVRNNSNALRIVLDTPPGTDPQAQAAHLKSTLTPREYFCWINLFRLLTV